MKHVIGLFSKKIFSHEKKVEEKVIEKTNAYVNSNKKTMQLIGQLTNERN